MSFCGQSVYSQARFELDVDDYVNDVTWAILMMIVRGVITKLALRGRF